MCQCQVQFRQRLQDWVGAPAGAPASQAGLLQRLALLIILPYLLLLLLLLIGIHSGLLALVFRLTVHAVRHCLVSLLQQVEGAEAERISDRQRRERGAACRRQEGRTGCGLLGGCPTPARLPRQCAGAAKTRREGHGAEARLGHCASEPCPTSAALPIPMAPMVLAAVVPAAPSCNAGDEWGGCLLGACLSSAVCRLQRRAQGPE